MLSVDSNNRPSEDSLLLHPWITSPMNYSTSITSQSYNDLTTDNTSNTLQVDNIISDMEPPQLTHSLSEEKPLNHISVFLSHDWGVDKSNHILVQHINEMLQIN
jgi:hypothetical protein